MNHPSQVVGGLFLTAILAIITITSVIINVEAMPFSTYPREQEQAVDNGSSGNINSWINHVNGPGASAQTVQKSTTEVTTTDGKTFVIDNTDGTVKQIEPVVSSANSIRGVPVMFSVNDNSQSIAHYSALVNFYCLLGLTMYFMPSL